MRDRAAVLAWTATSLAVLSAVCIPVAASLWVADSVASAFFQQPDDVAQASGAAPLMMWHGKSKAEQITRDKQGRTHGLTGPGTAAC